MRTSYINDNIKISVTSSLGHNLNLKRFGFEFKCLFWP